MKRLFSIILSSLATLTAWAQVTFTANVAGGNTVEAGTRIQVEYKINAQPDNFDCKVESSGLRLLSGPFSSTYMTTSFVNGKVSAEQSTTYTYVLMAEKEGSYTLPAATAIVGGKSYSSNSLAITAVPADPSRAKSAQQGSSSGTRQRSQASSAINKDDILLGVDLTKTTVFEGEALVATMKLYFRNQNVANVSDVKFPDLEGFTVQEIDLSQERGATVEQYKGGTYRAYPIRQWLLFPQRPGDITIKPGSLTAIVQVATARRSSFWDVFDDPFGSVQNVQVPVKSPERTVHVERLPSNKPASYMNAVGEFVIKSELTTNKLKANDAAIYRITINGTGNLKYIREPKPEFPADFEVFDPKTDLQSSVTNLGMKGKRVIEYTIIPRFGGKFTIPPVEFTFFSTNLHKYVTIKTDAQTIEVESDGSESATTTGKVDFSGTTQERIKVLGSDIRYLHPLDASQLRSDEAPLYGTWLYWLWFILPSAIFIALLYIYRRNVKLRADVVRQRTRKANKVATRRLKSAAGALAMKQENEFYEQLHKAMMGYVADKLNIPLSELTGDSIREELAKREVDDETIRRCSEVISTCEFARYAPSADDQAMDKLYHEASAVIGLLEKVL